jgi:hypothetical protein
MSDFLAIAFRLFEIFLRANNFVQRVNLLFSVKWVLTFCASAKLPWLSPPDDGKQSVSSSAVVLLVS